MTTQQIGRLALRHEGELWKAYYGPQTAPEHERSGHG